MWTHRGGVRILPNSQGEYRNFYHDDPIDLEEKSDKNFSSFLALIFLAIGATFLVQTTLAANIGLNSGAPVEFGQGFSTTTACSGNNPLTVTPSSAFSNASGGGSFKLSSVSVSGVPSDCYGSDFTINAFGDTDNTPLALFNTNSTNAIIYNNAGTFEEGMSSTGLSVSGSSGSFTVTFTNPVALTSSVFKITIQSGPHRTPITYNIGATGPGGGTVYYYNAAGFTCGPAYDLTCNYLEFAPSGWNATAEGSTNATGRAWATGTASSGNAILDVDGVTGSGGGIGVSNDSSNNTSTSTVGLGYRNSIAIVNQGNGATTAAGTARAYTGGSLTDWYLPNTAELSLLWDWKVAYGTGSEGFAAKRYWSSSEKDNAFAYWQDFGNGSIGDYFKNDNTYKVRAIRAF
ncbi:hypothetical protein MCEMRE26_01251 [Candidatus Nanopelagicaceae bacterium]